MTFMEALTEHQSSPGNGFYQETNPRMIIYWCKTRFINQFGKEVSVTKQMLFAKDWQVEG